MVYYIGETIFFGVILMIRELKPSHKYSSVITALSVLSLAFYFLYGLIGELSLPMASAFLATLFIFENPNKRIFSFLIPVMGIAFNLAIHGIYMLVSLEIVVVALIIALCYRYSETKNICAVYLTVIIAVFILVSFYIGGARSCESFDFQIVADYYSGLYTELKSSLASMIASIKGTVRDGAATSIMTEQQAKDMIEQYSKLTVAYIGAFSFLLAVIAFNGTLAASKDSASLRGLKFATSNIIPLVGSSVSEAMKTLIAGATEIKSTLGIAASYSILYTTLPGIISIFIQKL